MKAKRQDLIDARRARKLTQAKLAELIGKDQTYVSRIETGDYKVDAATAFLLAKPLRMPLLRILFPKEST